MFYRGEILAVALPPALCGHNRLKPGWKRAQFLLENAREPPDCGRHELGRNAHDGSKHRIECLGLCPFAIVYRAPLLCLPDDMSKQRAPPATDEGMVHITAEDKRTSRTFASLLQNGFPNFVSMRRETTIRFELSDTVLGIRTKEPR